MIADSDIIALAVFLFVILLLLALTYLEDSVFYLFPCGVAALLFSGEVWTVTADVYLSIIVALVGISILIIPTARIIGGRPA